MSFIRLTAIIATFFYSCFIATLLWKWFIVPLGVIPITIPWVVGLQGVLFIFFPEMLKKDEIINVTDSLLKVTSILIVGFIAHKLM